MAKDPSGKEYLTENEFKIVVKRILTQTDTKPGDINKALQHIQNMFLEAEDDIARRKRSGDRSHDKSVIFQWKYGNESHEITYKYQSSAAQQPLIHSQHVAIFAKPKEHIAHKELPSPLISAQAADTAPETPAANILKPASQARKKAEELGDDWLKYNDVLKGVATYLKNATGADAGARSRVNKLIKRIQEKTLIADSQEGEVTIDFRTRDGEEKSATIRYHKYGVKNIASFAIHKESITAFYEVAASSYTDRAMPEATHTVVRRDNSARVVR